MKPRRAIYQPFRDEGSLIVSFGGARLIKYLNGSYELIGGSEEDRKEAREWTAKFLRGVVVREATRG